jgi:cytochrome b561
MTAQKLRIGFHWMTLGLVVAVYGIAFGRSAVDAPDTRLLLRHCHRLLGFLILIVTLARFAARRLFPVAPAHEPTRLLRFSAQAAHYLRYAGLVALPLLGWAQSSARARHFRLFGVDLPAIVHHDGDLGARLAEWHETAAWAMLALIGLHSLAALFHHFVRRDTVLVDMLRIHAH